MMHLNPLFDEDKEDAGRWRDSFPTGLYAEEALMAEILDEYKRYNTRLALFGSTVTSTDSASLVVKPRDAITTAAGPTLIIQAMPNSVIDAWTSIAGIPESFTIPLFLPSVSLTQPSEEGRTSVRGLILQVRTNSDIPFANRLAARLEYFVEVSEEEFPEQEPMSSQSLENFVAFIRSIPDIAYPDVVLTYEGHIRAEWTKSRNRHFAVEFLGDNEVRFVVFVPDSKKPHKTNRASGLATTDSLLELMHPYGVLDWITAPNKNAA